MHVFDRRQLEQMRGMNPDLERRFKQLLAGHDESAETGAGFMPAADVVMGRQELVVVLELAGLRREDIRLAAGDGELVIQGVRREPVEFEKERFLALEIPVGDFERRIQLPAGLLMEQVAAQYRDGFLVVRIPRQDGGQVAWSGEDEQ
jgi:HSP20 family protein